MNCSVQLYPKNSAGKSLSRRSAFCFAASSVLATKLISSESTFAEERAETAPVTLQQFLTRRANPFFTCSDGGAEMYSIAHVIGLATSSDEWCDRFLIDSHQKKLVNKKLQFFSDDLDVRREKSLNFRKSFNRHVLEASLATLSDQSLSKIWQAVFCCEGLGACTLNRTGNPAYIDASVSKSIMRIADREWDRAGRSFQSKIRFGSGEPSVLAIYMMKGTRLDHLFSDECLTVLDSRNQDRLADHCGSSVWFMDHLDRLLAGIVAAFSSTERVKDGEKARQTHLD